MIIRIAFLVFGLVYATSLQANVHYQFKVYLNDKEIGYHNFLVSKEGTHVTIDAGFESSSFSSLLTSIGT